MRRISILLAILALPCASLVSLAQPTQNSWATLSALRAGQRIQIVDTASKKYSGDFESVSETAISFREHSGERSIQKQDVRAVKLTDKRHRGRNVLIGAVVGGGAGAGVGAAIGAATYKPCPSTGFCLDIIGKGGQAAIGAALGFVGGVIPGTIIGASVSSHTAIYSSKAPASPQHTP